MKNNLKNKVAVIGLWHLGLVNCVGFAEKGYEVVGVDFNPLLITKLKKGIPPLYEPGLEDKIKEYSKKNILRFSSEIKEVENVNYVIIAYDSPVDEKDRVSIIPVEQACKKITDYLNPDTLVVITSQVPLGTCEMLEKKIKKINNKWLSGIVYTPENLKLGEAINRFLQPDFLVFGSKNQMAQESAKELYKDFNTKKFFMDHKSSEMVKHGLNTYLATAITFGNEIARLSEKLGANGVKVALALKADARIGKAPIFPGLGYSGGTIARDVTQLLTFSRQKKYKSNFLNTIVESNEQTFKDVVDKLVSQIKNLNGKTIGILGITYKPGTSTLRRSPAIKLIQLLNNKGARCIGYDPKADTEEVKQYTKLFKRVNTVRDLVKESDALVLVTEWPEFKTLPYSELSRLMKQPLLIDTKNYLDPDTIRSAGFRYVGFGQ